ncbi:MAG: S24 family peptidase [Oscillospiraceae bacterium]|nr:S24 family peptidase [Oscillospiraceae bacterium]
MEDLILLPVTEDMPAGTDFCLRLDNDCMEPWFHRGQLLYVSRAQSPEEMAAGIFFCRGRILCRQWCEDYAGTLHLLCANPERESENLSLSRDEKDACLCLGTVLPMRRLPMPVYGSRRKNL